MAPDGAMTERQQEVLAAINDYIAAHKRPPTVRDLATILGISSSVVHRHLQQLRDDGHVDWDEGMYRTLRVTEGDT